MVYSASLRKIIMLAFTIFLGSLVVIRAIQRYSFGEENFIISENENIDFTHLALHDQAGAEESPDAEGGVAYDFSAMLKLIDLARYVKGEMAVDFGFVPRRKRVNVAEIRTLLDALLREQAGLRNYIWELKGHAKTGIPPRRYRSLMYYMEVLDGLVTEMRELLPTK